MTRLSAVIAAALALALGQTWLSPAAAAPPSGSDKRALIVGITDYEPPTVPTAGGAGDAGAVQAALLKNGWSKDNIRMLVDGDATADNIRSGIDWLVSNSGPNSFSLFHYSGHTKQEQRGMADGDAEDYDELIWSVRNEFIADGELGERLRGLQGRSVISIAACEAAGFDDNISAPNRLVLAASKETEKAYEYTGAARSVFVDLVYDQALSGGAGDTDGNKAVSLQEAMARAAVMAPKATAEQKPYGPQTPVMAGGDGSQWFLGAPPAAPGLVERLVPPGLLPPGLLPGGGLSGLAPQTP
jgi:hypothetical protein